MAIPKDIERVFEHQLNAYERLKEEYSNKYKETHDKEDLDMSRYFHISALTVRDLWDILKCMYEEE